ncbi:AbrB/MazE/SpoVT family DNA-binding domain-containing protein [Desulfocurvibacter africanus]|uniref:Transcriptional regulator/antitoxin, MazE n=1 Tax=Desulfocurvibacter africanus subsp. africanus str. Walvis Bay TaxID=690850 RepID=F3YXI9_DESAF|nr:AbrB/MazE/SpoVT family DNA-binding domain-containing protein [Desulfocurvibacter africanus]EGJ51766.1 transcriptional regulator/antitoxin, MazE [Desulfocurvibacter africanus subsp. africanus str. Walvis Bay]
MATDSVQDVHGTAKVSRWGNSLGLRIPKAVSEAGELREGDLVEFLPAPQGFCIRKKRVYSLDELVAGISEENRHAEASWGKPMGNEAW